MGGGAGPGTGHVGHRNAPATAGGAGQRGEVPKTTLETGGGSSVRPRKRARYWDAVGIARSGARAAAGATEEGDQQDSVGRKTTTGCGRAWQCDGREGGRRMEESAGADRDRLGCSRNTGNSNSNKRIFKKRVMKWFRVAAGAIEGEQGGSQGAGSKESSDCDMAGLPVLTLHMDEDI